MGVPPRLVGRSPVTLIGRGVREDDGSWRFGWPNTAIGVRFLGTELDVLMEEVGPRLMAGQPLHNQFDIWLDGVLLAQRLTLSPQQRRYPLVRQLAAGEHSVWLRKRTEGLVGSARFVDFVVGGLDAGLLPPPEPAERQIVVIGASNEAGYGVERSLRAPATCGFTAETENANLAWPALLASSLSAELTNLAASGKGILRSNAGSTDAAATLPGMFDRADPLDAKAVSQEVEQGPRLVLIDLGGNDYAQGAPDQEAFIVAYAGFLRRVQARYPRAEVVCLISPSILPRLRPRLRQDLQQAIMRASEPRRRSLDLFEFTYDTGDTFGCDGHPDRVRQLQLARQVAPLAMRLTGWVGSL